GHLAAHQLRRECGQFIVLAACPAVVDRDIFAFDIGGFLQPLTEPGDIMPECLRGCGIEETNYRHRRLLRARREGPRNRRAPEQRDEFPPPHSMTSSAATSSLSGTVKPSILAVEALMTNSNLVACKTGRSVGLAPLRIRPV